MARVSFASSWFTMTGSMLGKGHVVTDIADILEGLSTEGDGYAAFVPGDWLQGRTTFGGLTAALSIASAQRQEPGLPPLRSAQFAFVGPVEGAVRMLPTVLRRGRSSAYVSVDVVGEGGLAARSLLLFAAGRDASHRLLPGGMPSVPAPEACPDFFDGPGAPAFTRHFEARFAGGGRLLSGAGHADFRVWVRHRSDREAPPTTRLVALGDALPPAILSMASSIAPVSTMTWSIDLAVPDDLASALDGRGWHLMESRADAIADGYSSQAMSVWRPDGVRVLAGRQVVAAFI